MSIAVDVALSMISLMRLLLVQWRASITVKLSVRSNFSAFGIKSTSDQTRVAVWTKSARMSY